MKNQKLKNLLLNTTIPILLYLILFSPFRCLAKCTSIEISGIEGKVGINYLDYILDCIGIINILVYAAIYFIITAFSLFTGCLLIKQRVLIKSWRFLKYILLAAIGGLLIAAGVSIGASFLNNILIIFLILLFYNYLLARKILNLNRRQSIFVGTIVGVFSNISLIYLIARMFPIIE